MYTDKVLVCKDCGEEFTFTSGEQEFYFDKGLTNTPQRCNLCRAKRRNNYVRKPFNKKKIWYEIVCARCGKVESIPFEPSHNKPVYCHGCYRVIMKEL